MRKKLSRSLALTLTVLMLLSALPLQAMAADYRGGAQSGTSHSYIMDRFTMFEATEASSNGRLKVVTKARGGATSAQLNAAADKLTGLMAQTGSNTIDLNNKGIYINGRNAQIKAGDCFIYSPTWNNGLITVDNGNIRYTVNVVCGWDASQQDNVVKSISYGKATPHPPSSLPPMNCLRGCSGSSL